MAGLGYKTFNVGDVLTAAQVQGYLQDQTVMRFATATARNTAIGANVAEGMLCYLDDSNAIQYYDGSTWQTLSTGGDITGVTAGTGISGGGTSGDVTITNSMATAIDAKGDLIAGTGADTFSRLAVGANNTVLTADSTTATGLKWAAAAGGGFFKNPILNSNFSVWQRGTSFANPANGYTADRWLGSSSTALTVSRQTTSDTTNLPNIQYCIRVQRNSGSTTTQELAISQSFESINSIPFAGKTITFSFYARAGSNYSVTNSTLSARLQTGTGTDQNIWTAGYTGSATPISQAATLTTTWQRFSYSATLASNITELGLIFGMTGTGTAGANDYFEVTGVQIEIGSSATDYYPNGNTYQPELAACQRYYQRKSAATNYYRYAIGTNISSTQAGYIIPFGVQMRTTPSFAASGSFDNVEGTTSKGIVAPTLSSDGNSSDSCFLNTAITSATTGYSIQLRSYSNTTSYLEFSAEL